MSVERILWWVGDNRREKARKDFLTASQAAEAIRNDDFLFPVLIERHTQKRLIVESPYTNSQMEFIGPIEDLWEIRTAIKFRPRKVRKTAPSPRAVAAVLLEHRGPNLPH
jgi:hypothetical protein